MRSKYIPEDCRSTIMNFFRMPLNLFVCVVRAVPETRRLVEPVRRTKRWHSHRVPHEALSLSCLNVSREWLVDAGTVQRVGVPHRQHVCHVLAVPHGRRLRAEPPARARDPGRLRLVRPLPFHTLAFVHTPPSLPRRTSTLTALPSCPRASSVRLIWLVSRRVCGDLAGSWACKVCASRAPPAGWPLGMVRIVYIVYSPRGVNSVRHA